ncbi:MAG TPA: hypothetical protein DDW52_25825 [Planctomycetaceae bacterium]|nr:hypothetical protein [Planctomycetaceae bacterium]
MQLPSQNDRTSSINDRDPLDLLSEQFIERRRRGESLTVEAFAAEHPQHAEQIRAVFPALLIMHDAKQESDETGATDGKLTRDKIGDYRLIRVIGQGGMGVVYEAEHEALGRRVALKTLPPTILQDSKLSERFRREARAAAGLHHTNIIPVFDVGQDDDVCFYTMQLIEGRGLDEVYRELVKLDASGSDTSKYFSELSSQSDGSTASGSENKRKPYYQAIAKLGADIADALAYAHDRNIVHRDVKPSNLVLDNSGVVWLADFGLAKTEDVDLTATGDFIGTARYMAPERFKNAGDHRVDIYGLGMSLYELLTLQKAFDAADRLQIVDQVANVEPPRPRDVNRSIPLDLETVVLKAMHKDPRRRYVSALELAADLRRVVEDQPIQARRASTLERTSRWVRRNKSLTAAMLAMASLIAVLIVSTVVVLDQRDQARINLAEAERQEELAKESSELARSQKAIADENFQIAFDAVDEYFVSVSQEQLLNEPGMEPLRAKLVGAAVSFYEELVQRGGDAEVQLSYIDSLHRLGVVEDSYYSKDKAIEYFQKAIQAATQQAEGNDDPEPRKRLVRAKAILGDVLLNTSKPDEAIEVWNTGIRLGRDLFATTPSDAKARRLLSDIIGRTAAYYSSKADFERALSAAEESRDILIDDPDPAVEDFEHHRVLGLAHRLVGAVQTRTGAYVEASENFQRAKEEFRRALVVDQNDTQVRWLFSVQDMSIGRMLSRVGHTEEALACTRQAIESLEELSRDFPLSRRFQRDVANAYSSLGSSVWAQGKYAEAQEEYLRALELREKLFRDSPNEINNESRVARLHNNIALTYRKLEENELAEKHYRLAIKFCESVCDQAPDRPSFFSDLSRSQSGLATLYLYTGRPDEAEGILKESLAVAEEQYARSPQVVEMTLAVQDAASTLGELLRDQGKLAEAAAVLLKANDIGESTLEFAKNNLAIIKQLTACHQTLGQIRMLEQDPAAAADAFRAALEYAVSDEKQLVARLQLAQAEFGMSAKVDWKPLVAGISQELLQSSGRINLELAGLYAAAHASDLARADEPSADENAKYCLKHLRSAEALGMFEIAEQIDITFRYPMFRTVLELDEFQAWKSSLLVNDK